MNRDAVAALFDSALELVATAEMSGATRPTVRIEFDARPMCLVVLVDGKPVAGSCALSLETGARVCREALLRWIDGDTLPLAAAEAS